MFSENLHNIKLTTLKRHHPISYLLHISKKVAIIMHVIKPNRIHYNIDQGK